MSPKEARGKKSSTQTLRVRSPSPLGGIGVDCFLFFFLLIVLRQSSWSIDQHNPPILCSESPWCFAGKDGTVATCFGTTPAVHARIEFCGGCGRHTSFRGTCTITKLIGVGIHNILSLTLLQFSSNRSWNSRCESVKRRRMFVNHRRCSKRHELVTNT